MSLLLLIIFISLGGVPPFIGFFAKLVVLKELASFLSLSLLLLLLICSGLIILFYTRYSFSALSLTPRSSYKALPTRSYLLGMGGVGFNLIPLILFIFFDQSLYKHLTVNKNKGSALINRHPSPPLFLYTSMLISNSPLPRLLNYLARRPLTA